METAARPYGPPSDCFLVEPGQRWAYAHRNTYTEGLRLLGQCLLDDPHRFAKARVVLAERFALEVEEADLDGPIVEITAERFEDMLGCLPPLAWVREGDFERFNQPEFFTGRVTVQAARLGERYFTRRVRHGDRATYMRPDVITAALDAGEVAFPGPPA